MHKGKESHFCMKGVTRHPWVPGVNSSHFNGTVTGAVITTFGSIRGSWCYLRTKTRLVLWTTMVVKVTRDCGFPGPVQQQPYLPLMGPCGRMHSSEFHKQWFSTRRSCSQGTFGKVYIHCRLLQNWRRGFSTGIYWVEARDSAKTHSVSHRRDPTTESYLASKVDSAETEEPWFRRSKQGQRFSLYSIY